MCVHVLVCVIKVLCLSMFLGKKMKIIKNSSSLNREFKESSGNKVKNVILDFKLSPCPVCNMFSFG